MLLLAHINSICTLLIGDGLGPAVCYEETAADNFFRSVAENASIRVSSSPANVSTILPSSYCFHAQERRCSINHQQSSSINQQSHISIIQTYWYIKWGIFPNGMPNAGAVLCRGWYYAQIAIISIPIVIAKNKNPGIQSIVEVDWLYFIAGHSCLGRVCIHVRSVLVFGSQYWLLVEENEKALPREYALEYIMPMLIMRLIVMLFLRELLWVLECGSNNFISNIIQSRVFQENYHY